MFNLFKKKKKLASLSALTHSKILDISEVPDQVFATKMVGDGIAFIPYDGMIKSPCKGKVVQIFPTKHAMGIITDEGLEVLIHLGMDTVELKGEGFESYIKVDQEVVPGDFIAKMDLDYIKAQGKEIISAVIITNMETVEELEPCYLNQDIKEGQILNIKLK